MAVKKTTKTNKAANTNKPVKTTKKMNVAKLLEKHIYVILAVVVIAFILFSLGMAAGAAIIIN